MLAGATSAARAFRCLCGGAMPLGTLGNGAGPYWAYIAPVARINLVSNPSLEYGTTGWGTITAGTVGTTSDAQQFGAWAGSFAPTSATDCGVLFQMGTSLAAGTHTISAYVNGSVGVPMRLAIAVRGGASLGSTTFTAGGTWQRYSFQYTEVGGAANRDIWISKANSNNTSAFYFDGVQVEQGLLTTYIDGDQDGCTWLGPIHASTSARDGQSRAGGSVIALADIGMYVDDATGIGMPPLENSYQSYAIIDGAQYQRTRAGVRSFTLSAQPLSGTSWQDLHTQRRALINAFKIDATTPQQPTRFWYIGAGGTVQIDAVLDAGLEMGQADGFSESLGMRFLAFDPYWKTTTQDGTALAPRTALGSTNFIAWRDALGRWGTIGVNGTTIQASGFTPYINTILPIDNQTVLFGGVFGTVGGTIAAGIGKLDKFSGLGTLTGGTLNQAGGASGVEVRTLTSGAAGTVLMGGNWGTIGGTVYKHIGFWNQTAFGTLTGGTVGLFVNEIIYAAGTAIFGGQFSDAGGTTAWNIAMHVNGAFGTLTGGTVNAGNVSALARGLDGRIFLGGGFTGIGGTNAAGFGYWKNGAYGTFGSTTGAGYIYDIAVAPNGVAYFAGLIGSVAPPAFAANGIFQFNGAGLTPVGSGLTYSSGAASEIHAALYDRDGFLWLGGRFNQSGGVLFTDPIARYTGYSFLPADIAFSGNGTINAIVQDLGGTIWVGGGFVGTAQAASVAQLVNSGLAQVYPTIRMKNIGASGTARVWQLVNTTTGDGVYFNLSLQPQEEAILNLQPGTRSFTSNYQGNIFGAILPGSNLATLRLLPGTNYMSFYSDSGSVQTSIYWTPRSWSADMGTVQ